MKFIDINSKLLKGSKNDRGYKAINNSLNNILSINKGSLPGNPEFGSNLSKYIFELIDPLITQLIKEEVISAIKRWEQRITVNKIDVIEDTDYNRVLIKIDYSIKQDDSINEEYIYKIIKN